MREASRGGRSDPLVGEREPRGPIVFGERDGQPPGRRASTASASGIAANTLSAALVAIVLSWRLGLEQFVPGALIVFGCWRLWRRGALRWPAELWPYAALCSWSLLSISALGGGADWALYLRGEAHLLVGLCAYLVAIAIDPRSAEFERFLKLCVGVVGVILVVSLLIVSGHVQLYYPSPALLAWPELETPSAFVNDQILRRKLGTLRGQSLLPGIFRQSSFFLYQGALATVLLVLQGWLLIVRRRLSGRWRNLATGGVAAAAALVVLTGSRSGVLMAWAVVAALGVWSLIADRPWRRWVIRVAAGLLLMGALVAVIPFGDETSLEGGAAWEKVATEFRMRSFIDRLDVYIGTTERVGERPWTGWGIQGRPGERNRYLRLGTHSEVLNVAYRFGWPGLFFYVAAIAVFVRWMATRSTATPERPAIALTLGALAATALVRSLQWDLNVFWLVLAFAGSSKALLAGTSDDLDH